MIVPSIETTAKFTFNSPFNVLDGIYTLTQLVSFSTAINDGVNFVDSLYAYTSYPDPDEAFATDWKLYQNDQVLKLVSIDDAAKIIYVPASLINEVPDPQIIKAHNLTLRVDLGLFRDPTTIAWIKSEIDDFVANSTGTTKTCHLFAPKTEYMTESEWQALEQDRLNRISELDLSSKTIVNLRKELDTANRKLRAYEEKIIAISQTP